jgi:hypothetical protein
MGRMIAGMVVGAYAMQGAKPASDPPASSYLSINEESFPTVLARMRAGKADIEKRQQELLAARYDLSDRPVADVSMSQGKAIQGGVRVKLRSGVTWVALARISPEEIRDKAIFPSGFTPPRIGQSP